MYNVEGNCKFYERERVFKFKIFKGNYESELEFPKGRGVQTNSWSIDFSETNFFRSKKRKCLLRNWGKLKCVRKRERRNSKIYKNLSQLLKIRPTRTDWSKLSIFGHSKVKLKWDRHLLEMSFMLSLLSNLFLCKIVVCSLFFSHSHQSSCFVSYYQSLRKPVGL